MFPNFEKIENNLLERRPSWFTPVELNKFNVENWIKPEMMKPYIAGNTKKNMALSTFNNNSALEG